MNERLPMLPNYAPPPRGTLMKASKHTPKTPPKISKVVEKSWPKPKKYF